MLLLICLLQVQSQELRLKVIMWLMLHEANDLTNHKLKEAIAWVDHKVLPGKEKQVQRRSGATDSQGNNSYRSKKRKIF